MATREVLISIVVSAVVSATVSLALSQKGISREAVDVPPLTGLRADQARALLEARGLLLALAEERDDLRFAPGQICDQKPLEGSRLGRGDAVTAWVARAPTTLKVPSVVGLALE